MLMLGQGQLTSGEEAANLSKADQSGEEAEIRVVRGAYSRPRRVDLQAASDCRRLTVKSGCRPVH